MKDKNEDIKHIVSFSGGKDSTAMLLMMLHKNMPIDEIVFCDTGMEFPGMYEHIHAVEYCINRPITVLHPPHTFEYYLGHHIKVKGKLKGKKGYGWTGHMFRWCTGYLKIKVLQKYLKGKGDYYHYLGIAKDEEKRAERKEHKKEFIRFPLIEWGITEKQALEYCYKEGFKWGGLYEKFNRVSCWCCPLQRIGELKTLYTDFPELWAELKRLDKLSYRQFRSDYSVEELEIKFKKLTKE